MGELRQDLSTRRWVVIASERAKRPHELRSPAPRRDVTAPAWDAGCPFCPGNEEDDLEVLRLPETGPWQVRVVGNRYPALRPGGELIHARDGIFSRIDAVGYHEVLVESPQHNTCSALEEPATVNLLLQTFRRRGSQIAQDARMQQLIFFKNHGRQAGTSLLHPHAQLIALPIVPDELHHRAEVARSYLADTGRCVICDLMQAEIEDGRRMVAGNDHFVAYIPFAAASPFHCWIVPRRHAPSFLHTQDDELHAMSTILHSVLRSLYDKLGDPDFNYVIRSTLNRENGVDANHWYLTIIPRITRAAGFELGTEMFINPVRPEDAAEFLREDVQTTASAAEHE